MTGKILWLVVWATLPVLRQGYAQKETPARKGKLLYENRMSDSSGMKGWVMEGPGVLHFTGGWMQMYSPDKKWDHVLWCPEVLPASFIAEWDATNLGNEGLAIVFFAATGEHGQSIFDPELPKRDGTFRYYNKGKIHCYHISYYADNPKLPDRGDSRLRKDPGAILLKTGAPGIPVGSHSVYHIRLVKDGGRISMYVNGVPIIEATDDGRSHGPVYGSGRLGFRQMRWSFLAYRNFKVWEIKKDASR